MHPGKQAYIELLTVFFAVGLGCVTPSVADEQDHSPQNLVGLYHPLITGTTWKYQVMEDGDSYVQTIELEKDSSPGVFVMKTSSKWRRVRYFVAEMDGVCVLTRIEAKLFFLPFKRTAHFDPPLPFLDFENGVSCDWSWSGRSEGYGPCLVSAGYTMAPLSDRVDKFGNPDIEVTATSTDNEGNNKSYKAVYSAGIGLKSVEMENYQKALIHFDMPSN